MSVSDFVIIIEAFCTIIGICLSCFMAGYKLGSKKNSRPGSPKN